jgi:phage baseplate assembly protein W
MINAARYRAWRFVHPDIVLEEGAPSGGLQVTPRGRIDMVQDDASIRQSLLLLLSTSPGERVMRPDYGCHLRRLVFAPNDETTAGLAIHYVRQAVGRWEPRVEIIGVDAGRADILARAVDPERAVDPKKNDPKPEQLLILLDYRVRATRRVEAIAYSLDLTGEAR